MHFLCCNLSIVRFGTLLLWPSKTQFAGFYSFIAYASQKKKKKKRILAEAASEATHLLHPLITY